MNDSIQTSLFELESELQNLKNATAYMDGAQKAVESAEAVLNITRDLQQSFNQLKTATEELTGRIMKVDFPIRLDKIDTNISTVNLNISNIQSRLEATEKSIVSRIDSKTSEVLKSQQESRSAIDQVLKQQTAAINTLRSEQESRIGILSEILSQQNKDLRLLKLINSAVVFLVAILVIKLFI